MLAVVLAAGGGTRLGPLTAARSKAMMPIAGKPMIMRVLDMLAAEGVKRFVVVVHLTDRELVEELRQSSRASAVRLAYQDERQGMADAVECAAPLIQEEDTGEFLLAACDSLYPEGHVGRLITQRRTYALDAVLTLMWASRQEAISSAVVTMQDELVTNIIEKPHPEQIPSGDGDSGALSAPSLYALTDRILDYLPQVGLSPRQEREFPDALRLLIADGGEVGGRVVSSRTTVTQPEDLLVINRHFLRGDRCSAVVETDIPSNVIIVPPVRIEAGARVGPGCEIGPEAYLETGCTVREGTTIRRAVILRGASVEANQLIDESVIA
jgi:NDP-sugar pyrophosphorylase family protein